MIALAVVLSIWGLGSIGFVLALGGACTKAIPGSAVNRKMVTADEILQKLNLLPRPALFGLRRRIR